MNNKIVKFVQTIPGWLTLNEGQFLEKAAQETEDREGVVVEIGSYCGKSTIWLAQSARKVYAVDPHLGYVGEHMQHAPTYERFTQNLRSTYVLHKVVPIVKTSCEAVKNWHRDIRVLFIDGLHDEKNASLDFELWSSHVVNGGIVAIHDSFRKWCGSEKVAIKKIVNSPEYYKIGYVDSIIYGVKGKGNIWDYCKKFFWQITIVFLIEVYHISEIPNIVKEVLFKRATMVFPG